MRDLNFDNYPRRLTRIPRDRDRGMSGSIVLAGIAILSILASGVLTSDTPLRFLNLEGFLIVLGGTLASTLIQFSLADLRGAFQAIGDAFGTEPATPNERMSQLLELSRRVKEQGILILEDEAEGEHDDFMRLGLMLIVDGRPLDDARRILKNEMEVSSSRTWRSVQVWETMGNFAPAMGLIGTLFGLIGMLGSLQDAATVGPAMSMALVATLYGSVAANLCFFPIAGKLRVCAQEREQCKSITLEGLLSIARLENPVMLEQRLQSFASIA